MTRKFRTDAKTTTPEGKTKYQESYMWAYRLSDRLKSEYWETFKTEMKEKKQQILKNLQNKTILFCFNQLLDNIPHLTDEQQKIIMQFREKTPSYIQLEVNRFSQEFDQEIEQLKPQFDDEIDSVIKTVLAEIKDKIAKDKKFRAEAEQRMREEIDRIEIPEIEVEIPFTDGVV